METKESLILDNEFIQYCKLNKIDDVQKLAREVFNNGFNILKYGNKPNLKQEKPIKEKVIKNNVTNIKKNVDDLYEE